ncbi:MAG: hypothetical protein WCL49_03535 [bacterium]
MKRKIEREVIKSSSTARGKDVSGNEQGLIDELADKLERGKQLGYEIGRLIDKFITLKGGVKYGQKTIEALSNHPKIQCHPKQLRRYWGYYLVFSRFGQEITKIAPKLAASYYYELARLLKLEDATDPCGDSTAGKELVWKQIKKHLEWKVAKDKAGQPITVDMFRAEISKTLEARVDEGAGVEKTAKPKSQPNINPKTEPKGKSDIGNVLSFDDKGLETVAEYIGAFSSSKHLASPAINPSKVCHQINKMVESLVSMIEFMVQNNEAGELNSDVFKRMYAAAGMVQEANQNSQANQASQS